MPATYCVHAAEPTPRFLTDDGEVAPQYRLELLGGDLGLAVPLEYAGERFAEINEEFHIQRRVDEPRLRERSGRPVGGRVLLGEMYAEQFLNDRTEADAGESS
jgi:hypothetical protein